MNRFYILLLFISNLGYSQVNEEQLDIYSSVFEHILKTGSEDKIDSIILIEQYDGNFRPSLDLLIDINKTISPQEVSQELYTLTYGDTTFIRRFANELDIRIAIKQLIDNFHSHPKFVPEDFEHEATDIQIITTKKFNSYFGRNYSRITKRWKRIYNRYGTQFVVEFSNIAKHKNFAALYYASHCGGVCGSGSIVVLEKVDGLWRMITEINFWMS